MGLGGRRGANRFHRKNVHKFCQKISWLKCAKFFAKRFHGKNMHKFLPKDFMGKMCTDFAKRFHGKKCAKILLKDFTGKMCTNFAKRFHCKKCAQFFSKRFHGKCAKIFSKKFNYKNAHESFDKNNLDAKQRCNAPNSLKPFLLSNYNYKISCCCDNNTWGKKWRRDSDVHFPPVCRGLARPRCTSGPMHVRSTSAIDDFPEVTSSHDTSEFIQVTNCLYFFSTDYSFEYCSLKPSGVNNLSVLSLGSYVTLEVEGTCQGHIWPWCKFIWSCRVILSVADSGCLSRILIFTHPGFRIPDFGFRI